MTSISQAVLPPQAPTARTSYASATKKTIPPPSVSGSSTPSAAAAASGPQHGKPDVNSSMNGNAISPAVPTVGTPTTVNGNTPTSSTSGVGEHTRKPSVVISATGASGYMPNGGPVAGKPKGGSNIQFGSVPEGSSAAANATPAPNQSTNSLAVNSPANPRVTSPQTSPSPIPQPPASGGGRPPSSLHGNSNSMSFGSFGGADANQMRPSGPSQGPLAPQTQPSHLRRESSLSQHSDTMSNQGMGSTTGRSGYPQGGRGRGGLQGQYPQQMGGYFPTNSRAPPNQPRGGQNMAHQGQNRNLAPYPNSPHQAARSPSLANVQPVHPQPGQVPMASPMGQHPYGYPSPYGGYPPNMGPPQVNPQSPSKLRGNASRFARPPSRGRGNARPDLSPATGNFEQFLTSRSQNQYMPQGYDPNYMQGYYGGQFYGGYPGMPPTSPRPPHQMIPGPQQPQYQPGQYSNQQQPSSMSRTSSAISHTERPTSSMGRQQGGSATPAVNNTAVASRPANSPAPKATSSFTIFPKKKSAAIIIKNPNTGEAVTIEKPAVSPAPPSKSQTPAVASTPTPPPRAPSHADSQHSRTESKSVKSDAEKRNEMREAIARKMEEDKAEEQRKRNEADSKAAQDKKDADAKQREAAVAQMEAEEASKKDMADAEEAEKAAAKAKDDVDEAAEKARRDQEMEDEIARMEAGFAEQERKEAEAELAYQAKKKAAAEEAARKEAEAAQMADDDMKKAEREAEEAEEARLKELEKGEGEDSQQERVDMFAALKKDGAASSSTDMPAAEETPVTSGDATPASDAPAATPKPSIAGGKSKPAALKLETSKKDIEQPQPSAALTSLRTSRRILDIKDVSYPGSIAPPSPGLNSPKPGQNTAAGKMGQFRYNRDFLMQFQSVFKEAPSENWTDRVRETVGDTIEPSSARATPRGAGGGSMGMAGRQSSNRAPMQQAPMGIFAAPGGRTLPSGTTSQQRFEAASRNPAPTRAIMQNPLVGMVGRPGGFPQPGAPGVRMDRTPSSTSMAHPNSPRNASQRGGSQRGSRAGGRREDSKDNKAMPFTAGVNLKPIEVTSSGWKPRSVGKAAGMAGPAPGGEGHMDPELVQRKVKSHLNKLTPNNFDKITLQLLDISAQSKDESDGRTLRQVIQLTFEKAIDEAHWAEMYAQFCKRMLESMSPEVKDENILDKKGEVVHGGALFRKYLLNRCQEEFEKGWKLNIGDKPEGDLEEAVMLSDAYYKEATAKRRGLGLVRFIGELYKLSMLTERIMHECVKKLVDYQGMPDEAEVESLTSLLRTIGQRLDTASNIPNGPQMMAAYFQKINQMIIIDGLPSRLRFMLMDIVELRSKGWQGKGGAIKGPMTIDGVRAQVAQQDREKETQRQADNSRRGGGGGGRPPIGRGDARNFSGGGQYGMMPPPDYNKNTVGMDDLRRLGSKGGSRQVSSQGQPTFGPTSMFGGAPRGSRSGRSGMGAASKDDSAASSRTGTPPALKEKKDKEEKEAASRTNTFSALAGLESSEATENASPATSPPITKSQPAERSSSPPKGKDEAAGEQSKPETS